MSSPMPFGAQSARDKRSHGGFETEDRYYDAPDCAAAMAEASRLLSNWSFKA